jgi:hypothetical protein
MKTSAAAEEKPEGETEPGKKATQPIWLVLVIAGIPSLASVATTWIKTKSSDERSAAGYEASRKALEVLQQHDSDTTKAVINLTAHVDFWERVFLPLLPNLVPGQPGKKGPPGKMTMVFPPPLAAPRPVQKVEFSPSIDDVVDAIKSGHGDAYVKEIYEGPPENAPEWTKEADKRAAAAY